MIACPRLHCNGTLGIMGDTCCMCARTTTGPRAPTAREAGDRRLEKSNVADYFAGIYHVDYVPTQEELSQAIW